MLIGVLLGGGTILVEGSRMAGSEYVAVLLGSLSLWVGILLAIAFLAAPARNSLPVAACFLVGAVPVYYGAQLIRDARDPAIIALGVEEAMVFAAVYLLGGMFFSLLAALLVRWTRGSARRRTMGVVLACAVPAMIAVGDLRTARAEAAWGEDPRPMVAMAVLVLVVSSVIACVAAIRLLGSERRAGRSAPGVDGSG